MLDGEPESDGAAKRVADDVGALDLEVVKQPDDMTDPAIAGVRTISRRCGRTEAELVGGDHPEPIGQNWNR